MRIRFLEAEATYNTLGRLLREATNASFAIAYLKRSGLFDLHDYMTRFLRKKGTGLNITVGASRFFITEPVALRQLLSLSTHFPNLEPYYVFSRGYHPKVFYFRQEGKASVVIGSSNVTGRALHDNTEANILIEDIALSTNFHKDLNRFLGDIGAMRAPLNRKFIDDYEAEYEEAKKRQDEEDSQRRLLGSDSTPRRYERKISMEIKRTVPLWKISPGREAEQWPDWEDAIIKRNSTLQGVIAIGWDEVGDLRHLKPRTEGDIDAIIEARRNEWKWSQHKDPSWYVAQQLWRFFKELREGHQVIVYSKKTLYAVGVVTSPYYYSGEEDGIFSHRRQIKLLSPVLELGVDKRTRRILGKRFTLYEVKKSREKAAISAYLSSRSQAQR